MSRTPETNPVKNPSDQLSRSGPNPGGQLVWEAPDADVWELETAHGSSFAPVVLRTEMEESFAEGFRRSFAVLGVPLSHIELRHVNGWPYVSFFLHDVPRKAGDPPPAFVLKLLTRIHPGFRKRTKIARAAVAERRPHRFADEWFDERQSWIDRILELQRADMGNMSDAQLADHLRRVADLAVDGLRRHFELVPGCIPVGEWLERAEQWGFPLAEARDAVMHSTPVHAEAQQRLRRIADALGESAPADLGQIRSHSTEAAGALDDYLTHHGLWATEDLTSSLPVQAFPHLVMNTIYHTRRHPSSDADEQAAATSPSGEALARLRAQVPVGEEETFDRLTRDAHRCYTMLDDNSGILGSWITGLTGHVLRTTAEQLADSGRVEAPDHVWALELDDIVELLEGRTSLGADVVAKRFGDWRALSELDPPPFLNGPPSPPPDPSVFPSPVSGLVSAIGTFLADKFNYANDTIGIGTRSARGRAVVVAGASDAIGRIEPGDILVTGATTPAYNAILPIVAGIIVSEGGPSCHAAVVARELDLPALVGYAEALTSIPDGALIELDPVRATVEVITGQ